MSRTEYEKRLYAALLHGMAMDIYTRYAIIILRGGEDETGRRLTEQGRKGFVREDFYQGYYKTAYARLADFGLVERVKRDGSRASISDDTGRWALAVDLDDVVHHVLSAFSLLSADSRRGADRIHRHGSNLDRPRPVVPKWRAAASRSHRR